MPNIEKVFKIREGDFVHAGDASMQVQRILKHVGCPPNMVRRAAICAYEAEMNVVMHGGEGVMILHIDEKMIQIEVSDNGPGIKDVEMAFKVGYSTAKDVHREMGFGAGMGLPNIKKNADTITIKTPAGGGTSLKMVFEMR